MVEHQLPKLMAYLPSAVLSRQWFAY